MMISNVKMITILLFLLINVPSLVSACGPEELRRLASTSGGLEARAPSASDTPVGRRLVEQFTLRDWNSDSKLSCADQTFDVSLVAETHLFLVLEPTSQEEHNSGDHGLTPSWCRETLLLHDGAEAGKVAEIASPEALARWGVEEKKNKDESTPHLLALASAVKFVDIQQAFHAAETSLIANHKDDSNTKQVYDIVDNNCATFVLEVADHLNIAADQRVEEYTVKRLAQNGHTAKVLRSSDKLMALLEDSSIHRPESSDEQLLQVLVNHYIKHRKVCSLTRSKAELSQDVESTAEQPPNEDENSSIGADLSLRFFIRNLQDDTSGVPLDPEQLRATCGSVEYKAMGGINVAHLELFATPVMWPDQLTDGTATEYEECQSVRFHMPSMVENAITARSLEQFSEGNLYPIGVYPLGVLLDAFEEAQDTTEPYDIVVNNMANILLDMLCSLGVEITEEMKEWAVSRLLATAESVSVVEKLLLNSSSLELIGQSTQEIATDGIEEDDVKEMVDYYVNNYDECSSDESSSKSTGYYLWKWGVLLVLVIASVPGAAVL